MILELVPVLSLFFLLTSTAGSALWVVRLESEKRRPLNPEEPVRRAEAVTYEDDPV